MQIVLIMKYYSVIIWLLLLYGMIISLYKIHFKWNEQWIKVQLHRENPIVAANMNSCHFKWVFLLKNIQLEDVVKGRFLVEIGQKTLVAFFVFYYSLYFFCIILWKQNSEIRTRKGTKVAKRNSCCAAHSV